MTSRKRKADGSPKTNASATATDENLREEHSLVSELNSDYLRLVQQEEELEGLLKRLKEEEPCIQKAIAQVDPPSAGRETQNIASQARARSTARQAIHRLEAALMQELDSSDSDDDDDVDHDHNKR